MVHGELSKVADFMLGELDTIVQICLTDVVYLFLFDPVFHTDGGGIDLRDETSEVEVGGVTEEASGGENGVDRDGPFEDGVEDKDDLANDG